MIELERSIYGTATLGAVIAALERAEPEADVQYDFCYTRPTTVASYRGYHDHLALGWSEDSVKDKSGNFVSHWPKAKDVLAELKSALGKTFKGYKGGDFMMAANTPLWVAKWGQSGGTGIVGMTCDEYIVMLITAHVD